MLQECERWKKSIAVYLASCEAGQYACGQWASFPTQLHRPKPKPVRKRKRRPASRSLSPTSDPFRSIAFLEVRAILHLLP